MRDRWMFASELIVLVSESTNHFIIGYKYTSDQWSCLVKPMLFGENVDIYAFNTVPMYTT